MGKENPLYDAGFKDGAWAQKGIADTEIADLRKQLKASQERVAGLETQRDAFEEIETDLNTTIGFLDLGMERHAQKVAGLVRTLEKIQVHIKTPVNQPEGCFVNTYPLQIRGWITKALSGVDAGTGCEWKETSECVWTTSCGTVLTTATSPMESDFKFCPYCGKPITQPEPQTEETT